MKSTTGRLTNKGFDIVCRELKNSFLRLGANVRLPLALSLDNKFFELPNPMYDQELDYKSRDIGEHDRQ